MDWEFDRYEEVPVDLIRQLQASADRDLEQSAQARVTVMRALVQELLA